MIPIRDEIPSRRAPVVTILLIGANVAVYLYQLFLPELPFQAFVVRFALVPARLSDPAWALAVGFPSRGLGTMLTSMFLHGGFLHLVGNLWSLWIFGDNVEDRLGRLRYLFFYLACGVVAGLTHWLSNPASIVPTVGASGAIAGVMGAYFLLYPHSRVLTLVPVFFYPLFLHVPAIVYLGLWIVLQLFSGTMSLGQGAEAGGIAFWAHVGGFAAGFVLAKLVAPREPTQLPAAARHLVYPVPPRSGRWRGPILGPEAGERFERGRWPRY